MPATAKQKLRAKRLAQLRRFLREHTWGVMITVLIMIALILFVCVIAGAAPKEAPAPETTQDETPRYWALLAACDQLEVLEDHYSPGCMLRRNREMLRRAQLLISVYDGTPGGTAATVRLAEELGITVLPLWM